MSYQALARKYRPKSFAEVVGQEHVVTALSNALNNDRIHHAFLFTGTRGVGKTTLARIFAKALNCETNGVSAEPCGTCSACASIDEGRFIDLVEVDAASRTKVEDTRDLLDNVQYAPTSGRYKVYLIDEVHMLSNSSFNALLKTLEEPPPHVKFLLATTDPQKLPVTVLSRCLQFNLKPLGSELISGQLSAIVTAEDIEFEPGALRLLSRSAQGSVRDALSLLDQAIAHGDSKVHEQPVRAMLGLIDESFVYDLLDALRDGDATLLLGTTRQMAERGADFGQVFDDMLVALHAVSAEQIVPGSKADSDFDPQRIADFAAAMDPLDLQLFYQHGLVGKRDLPFAPDPRTGFEMALMRMLAFQLAPSEPTRPLPGSSASGARSNATSSAAQPANGQSAKSNLPHSPGVRSNSSSRHTADGAASDDKADAQGRTQTASAADAVRTVNAYASNERVTVTVDPEEAPPRVRPVAAQPAPHGNADTVTVGDDHSRRVEGGAVEIAQTPTSGSRDIKAVIANPEGWRDLVANCGLTGVLGALAMHTAPLHFENGVLSLVLSEDQAYLMTDTRRRQLAQAITTYSADIASVDLSIAAETPPTPERINQRDHAAKLDQAERNVVNDENVQALQKYFGAQIVSESIEPAQSKS